MAVKNGEDRISQSIQSLLNQTYTNFELIIINDGSSDRTLEILESFNDPRIRLYSQINRGVAISANRGLALAKGKYIARQDHDDLSKPDRLEKQILFLESNPEISLLGTGAEIYTDKGQSGRYHNHPTNPIILSIELLFDNPFVHSSIMFRREIIKRIGLYNPNQAITPLDDYDFISRVAAVFKVANLPEKLVEYYESSNSLTSNFRKEASHLNLELKNKKTRIMTRNICVFLGISPADLRIICFSDLYAKIPMVKTENFNYQDMQNVLNEIFHKIDQMNPSLEISNNYYLKSDHLQFCWHNNLSLVRKLVKKLIKKLEATINFVSENLDCLYYNFKVNLRKSLSKLKNKLLNIIEK